MLQCQCILPRRLFVAICQMGEHSTEFHRMPASADLELLFDMDYITALLLESLMSNVMYAEDEEDAPSRNNNNNIGGSNHVRCTGSSDTTS